MKRSSMVLAVVAPLVTACTAAQSARVLAPGKTQLSVGAARSTPTGEAEGSLWTGQVAVRRGLGGIVDGGLSVQRTPGAFGAMWSVAVEPKVQLTPADSKTTLSVALAAGAVFEEDPDDDGLGLDLGLYVVAPTVLVGIDLAPTVELVFAPRITLLLPDEDNDDSQTEVGGALGLRFTDRERTWAVHPELSYLTLDEESVLTLGLSISAGN